MDAQLVKLVLILLIGLSVVTWSVMVWKAVTLWKKGRWDQDFLNRFWRATSLQEAEALAAKMPGDLAMLARVGFEEKSAKHHSELLTHYGNEHDMLERQLRSQLQRMARRNEIGLTELATIGSASPFVGLFGTVWGIKTALQDISSSGQAGLDVVAGPIGEALIATAAGIAVALPAVLAYNFFLRKLAVRQTEADAFCEDYLRLLCAPTK